MSTLVVAIVWIGLSIWMEEKGIMTQTRHWNTFGFLMGVLFGALQN